MPTMTVENYLKAIYLEQQRAGREPVSMGRLAGAVRVAPGTATAMAKSLERRGMVSYEPRLGVRLTRTGEQAALRVVRRHRIVELFLVKVLGLDWSEVHAEAERLEHALSDKVVERMDRVLGYPRVDPHGDPIPPARGRPADARLLPLSECPVGTRARIARVVDQEPQFLQFLDSRSLTPDTELEVLERDEQADAVRALVAGGEALVLGGAAAAKILVEPLPQPAAV